MNICPMPAAAHYGTDRGSGGGGGGVGFLKWPQPKVDDMCHRSLYASSQYFANDIDRLLINHFMFSSVFILLPLFVYIF